MRAAAPSTSLLSGRSHLFLVALLAATWWSPGARAQPGRHVVEAGREREVIALFAPHSLGTDVAPGWRLADVQIQEDHIVALVEGPDAAEASLRLEHPDRAPGAARSLSFAITRVGDAPGADGALDSLAAAVQRNDVEPFWRAREETRRSPDTRPSALRREPSAFLFDGIVISLLALALLLVLAGRQLREAPRWVGPALLAIVLGGGALRLAISPVTALGVWPFSRAMRLTVLTFEGPILGWITEALGTRVLFTELTFAQNLIVATLTPIAAYVHAHYVLRDARAALACAALFAVFPNHIRFSHSEVEFVLSLALSSFALALLHAALVERSRALSTASAIALPFALYAAVVTRELNILLVPLMIGASLMLRGGAPRPRLAGVLLGVTIGAVLGTMHLLDLYSTQVREGLRAETALNAVSAFFSIRFNTLINPWVTPPGVTALAVLGAVWMWREGERRHVAFLVGWLGFYFAAHSYVLPGQVAMQARYHLHLAPPLLLLAAPAIVSLWDRRRRIAWAVLAYVAISPLLHLGFIRDTAYNDMREYDFVRDARAVLPEGCTVLEYQGLADHDVRFTRMGLVLDGGERGQLWSVVPAASGAPAGADPLRAEVRALLDEPRECLAYYEGLQCWAVKDPAEPIAPACAALRELAPLEAIARTEFSSQPYDENLARGFGPDLDRVTLTLYRVRPRRAGPVRDAP